MWHRAKQLGRRAIRRAYEGHEGHEGHEAQEGQIVREGLSGKPALIDMSAPNAGFEDGAQMPFSELLLVEFRYSILPRQMVSGR